jgi:hypothetical protein
LFERGGCESLYVIVRMSLLDVVLTSVVDSDNTSRVVFFVLLFSFVRNERLL